MGVGDDDYDDGIASKSSLLSASAAGGKKPAPVDKRALLDEVLSEQARARDEAEKRLAREARNLDHATRAKRQEEAPLIEAAHDLGAGPLRVFSAVIVPLTLPGIIAAMIFAFTVSWAAFVYPMAFLYSADQQVLTVGTVTSLIRADVYKWGMLMAGALLAAAPPLVIYAFLMDYYIAGLTAGATKG